MYLNLCEIHRNLYNLYRKKLNLYYTCTCTQPEAFYKTYNNKPDYQ